MAVPPSQVVVHPLVLLSAVDHYNRVARDTSRRVVGVLLGSNAKGVIEATNSYAGTPSCSVVRVRGLQASLASRPTLACPVSSHSPPLYLVMSFFWSIFVDLRCHGGVCAMC